LKILASLQLQRSVKELSVELQGACWQYLRGNAYERRIRLALFRLDIDHVLILIFGHLAQEPLKPAAALSAYPSLQFCQRFINRLWLCE
jgi:hypothetical protein